MYKEVYIKHLNLPLEDEVEENLDVSLVFATCVRKLVFSLKEQENVISGLEGFKTLIEVISGLHSPFIGETEVMGQFRAFLKESSNNTIYKKLQPFFQNALAISREVRVKYLDSIKPPSYAYAAKVLSDNSKDIAVIGRGKIAQQIFKHYLNKSYNINFFSYTYSNRELPKNMLVNDLNDLANNISETLIIASPIDNKDLDGVIKNTYKTIIDFREAGNNILNSKYANKIYYLYDVHNSLKNTSVEIEKIKVQAIEYINELVLKHKKDKTQFN